MKNKDIITITYMEKGVTHTIHFNGVRWEADDAEVQEVLNAGFEALVGESYFPTFWHKAKAVADYFGGTVDHPEPAVPSVEGRVY